MQSRLNKITNDALQNLNNRNKKPKNQASNQKKEEVTIAGGDMHSLLTQQKQKHSFVQFAIKQQSLLKQKQLLFDQILQQALMSHFQAIKKCINLQQSVKSAQTQAKQEMNQIMAFLKIKDQEQIKFIQEPIKYFVQHCIQSSDNINIEVLIKQFILILEQIKNFVLIEEKLLKVQDLQYRQYIKNQNQMLIPTTINPNVYVKIQDGIIPVYQFLNNGKKINKQQLNRLKPEEKENIVNMVVLYLKSINMSTTKQQIQARMKQKIQSQNK